MTFIKHGQQDYTILVFIQDSASTTGAGKTGLDNTKVDFSYTRVETDNDVVVTGSITPVALTTLTDAHTDWGFKECDSTECPGLYRLDLADGVFTAGAWSAVVHIRDAGANNVAPVAIKFQLVPWDPNDVVRLGLTALPNAAADAAGGLPISDAGGLDIDNRMPSATAITNINTVYATDFAANYNTTLDAWNVNTTHAAGTAWGSGAITAAAVAADAGNEIADAVLSRSASNVEATAGRETLCAVALGMTHNSLTESPGNLVIFRSDGTTVFVTVPITSSAAAEHLTEVN